MNKDNFANMVHMNNPNLLLLDEYRDNHTSLACMCTVCKTGADGLWKLYPSTIYKPYPCPVCNKRDVPYLLKGYNDLLSWCQRNDREDIIADWDYEENARDPLAPNTPDEVARSDPKTIIHWKCHICQTPFNATTSKRTTPDRKYGTTKGCPHCRKSGTSFTEQAILYYIRKAYPNVSHRFRIESGFELDIFIPSIMTAIEYDGTIQHRNKLESDNKKDIACQKEHIRLIRLRDTSLPRTTSAEIIPCGDIQHTKAMTSSLNQLFSLLNIKTTFSIDVKKDYGKIIESFRQNSVEDSLAKLYPDIAKEWHPSKNGTITPDSITPGEAYPAWWQCTKDPNHEPWIASVYSRVGGGHGCPTCGLIEQGKSYRARKAKEMSLEKWCQENGYEDLLLEWDYEANKNDPSCPNKPSECPFGSPYDVHWRCPVCQHTWEATPAYRRYGKYSCENCRGILLIPGENDLVTWCKQNSREDILLDWDDTNNTPPEQHRYNGGHRVYWKCHKCQHTWSGYVSARTLRNKGCENCAHIIRAEKHMKKVRCVETGIIYDSVKSATMACGKIKGTGISSCLRGSKLTAYGYHWEYYLE